MSETMKYFYHFVCFYSLFFTNIYGSDSFNCHLPEKCHIQMIFLSAIFGSTENLNNRALSIMCDINDDLFEFKVNSETPIISGKKCEYLNDDVTTKYVPNEVIFKWSNTILDNRFNLLNLKLKYNRF